MKSASDDRARPVGESEAVELRANVMVMRAVTICVAWAGCRLVPTGPAFTMCGSFERLVSEAAL